MSGRARSLGERATADNRSHASGAPAAGALNARRGGMNRSEVMRRVKSADTTPERVVRQALRAIGRPGYRLQRKDLPGRPDIAYLKLRCAIFVHGCFWHGHSCKRGAREPKSNADYWRAKIARNRRRDAEAQAALSRAGWRVLVVWECEIRDRDGLLARLRAFLDEAAPPPPAQREKTT